MSTSIKSLSKIVNTTLISVKFYISNLPYFLYFVPLRLESTNCIHAAGISDSYKQLLTHRCALSSCRPTRSITKALFKKKMNAPEEEGQERKSSLRSDLCPDKAELNSCVDMDTGAVSKETDTTVSKDVQVLTKPTTTESKKGLRFWMIVVALSVTSLLTAMEATITSTALPTIIADLGGGDLYIWAVNGYFLTM